MKQHLGRLATLFIFIVLSWPILSAQPTLVLDQEQPVIDSGVALAIGGDSEQKLAQIVTAGVAGRLREVWLPVGCASGKLVLEIQGVTPGGAPDGVVHKRRTFQSSLLPAVLPPVFQQFRFGPSLRLAAGDPFAIVLSNPTGSCGLSPGPPGDSYAGGAAFFDARPNPPGWELLILNSEVSTRDLAFQTFMTVHP